MFMEADLQSHVAFFLTGKKLTSHLDEIEALNLRPALFANYRDLTSLRYDFPLVLVKNPSNDIFVEPLSGLIDSILDKVAQGDDGERIRKHVLHLERDIRALVADGTSGLFSTLWDKAAQPLSQSDKLIADSLVRARANLKIDGDVIDCDASMSDHLFGHAWSITQLQRARKFNDNIKRLILKLSDIIKADFVNSNAGKSPETLKLAFGSGPMDSFDFAAMSRILSKTIHQENLTQSRRRRVQKLITTLESQKFFPTAHGTGATYTFAFETCSGALKAYRDRLPKAIELAKAITIAEMEVKGEYNESIHDVLFESFGENGLDTNDLALLPDYLVRLDAKNLTGTEQNALVEILSLDLPIKILIQTDDVIEESSIGNGHLAFALRSRHLASMAMGMNTAFVLQSPASNLYRLRNKIQRGLNYPGPALFSVFSGATKSTNGLPPYLIGAAALESRVFPAFTFDPSAGCDWASRFSLSTNPQVESDWPVYEFSYEDEACQNVGEHIPFTLIDFVACDSRFSKHFARVPRVRWGDTLIPICEALSNEGQKQPLQLDKVPYLIMVSPDDKLQKLIVDEKLIREAHRCRTMWNSLQELGGIHNSHAEKLLAQEKENWEETIRLAEAKASSPREETSETVAAASTLAEPQIMAVTPTEKETEKSPDEAYIETPRCSTCNECTQINSKMFAYDGNKQAYIADINAGTYAQLVEAAENCQVSIIHPGKPRNPNEPGLDDLLKRAEHFL